MAPEYIGYGLYEGKISPDVILSDSLIIHKYAIENFPGKKIVAFGRSIGSSPAIYLASQKKLDFLILFAPLKSIQTVVSNWVWGFGSWISRFVPNPFINDVLIEKIQCPILFLHGAKDTTIPSEHSKEMHSKACNPLSELVIRPFMSHNGFFMGDDICKPIQEFMNKLDKKKGNLKETFF